MNIISIVEFENITKTGEIILFKEMNVLLIIGDFLLEINMIMLFQLREQGVLCQFMKLLL